MTKTIVPTLPMPPEFTPDGIKALTDEALEELKCDSSEVHKLFDNARGKWLTYWCQFYNEQQRREAESAMREKLIPELRAELEPKIRTELSNPQPSPEKTNESAA